jgi:hypothetical protein
MAEQFDLTAPVLITGRGGSGTRLLSRLLQQSSLFLGNRLNRQGDSLEWVQINRRMMFENIKLSNGRFNHQWQHRLKELAADITAKYATSEYSRWGLKLPEMLFMLPEFFATFPNTKLIHLIRHPVSLSCRRTHITSRMDNPVGQWVLPQAYDYLGISEDVIDVSDVLNNAISWKFQLDIITAFCEQNLSNQQFHVVKFEDMLDKPQDVLTQLGVFLGHDTSRVVDLNIDKNRAGHADLVDASTIDEVWSLCGETASKYGYTKQNHQVRQGQNK